jgi:hypothetical protein
MIVDGAAEFTSYLLGKHHIAGDGDTHVDISAREGQGALRKLWESTDLSANDFADV